MINAKLLKSILLKTTITLGLSLFISYSALAATYTTVGGDSLYKISKVFNTSVEDVMNDNGLTSTTLNIGQVLKVPCKTYIVKSGDSLYLISKQFEITLSSLRRANNIYTDYLDIGQELNIPIYQAIESSEIQTTNQSTTDSYSAYDLDLLSRLITAEAQGEPYDAKVAVGAVVMNRVKCDSFPNTINDVIYQNINGYYQFTPVLNGWINKPADSDSIKAAKEVLDGLDTTDGSLFYYDDSTTNEWILSKQVSTIIGKMIFAY